jgi:hypothetical protein
MRSTSSSEIIVNDPPRAPIFISFFSISEMAG